jgi:hypothetical protein
MVGVLCLAAPAATQAEEIFICPLTGEDEVPPVDTLGEGFAIVVINSTQTEIRFLVAFDGMTTNAISSHIHFAAPGADGPIIFDLGVPPNATGGVLMGTLTEANFTPAAGMDSYRKALEAMRRGKMYVNVHSAMHTGGEIRGQLTKL